MVFGRDLPRCPEAARIAAQAILYATRLVRRRVGRGEGYHANWLPAEALHQLEVDADHWKTWAHQRLSTPMEKPVAMTLFRALPNEHLSLAKHLTAEIRVLLMLLR